MSSSTFVVFLLGDRGFECLILETTHADLKRFNGCLMPEPLGGRLFETSQSTIRVPEGPKVKQQKIP